MRGGGIKYKSTARGDVVMTLDASVNDFVALVPGLDDIVNAINGQQFWQTSAARREKFNRRVRAVARPRRQQRHRRKRQRRRRLF